jgi:hypothetical protein
MLETILLAGLSVSIIIYVYTIIEIISEIEQSQTKK